VDRRTINDQRLSFKARGILVWLLDKPDDWQCSSAQIECAGTEGREAIRGAMRELEENGYLVRTQARDPETQQFVTTSTVHEVPPEWVTPVTGSRRRVAADGEPYPPIEDCLPKTVNEPPTPPEGGKSEVDAAFDEWYSLYPRKDSRPRALRAFRTAAKEVSIEDIFAGLHRWIAHWTADGTATRFIPQPATWLNGDKWNDECPALVVRSIDPRDRARAALNAMIAHPSNGGQHELG
jgi:hypothetical protein